MKIQLDTDNKTIKLENDILLEKLVKTLDSLLPNKEWKKYTLQTNTTIEHWHSPTIIREKYIEPYYPRPWVAWYATTPLNGGSLTNNLSAKTDYKISKGIYNVELKA